MSLPLVAALQLFQAEPLRAPPIDQCGDDPTFVEYREKLAGAVALKDADALRPLVDLNIKYSLGPDGGDGWSGFVRNWNLDRPEDSELWPELSEVLNLGCEWDDGQPTAPGNFSQLPHMGEGLQPFFAVQKDAALRSRPDDKAALVRLLDNHVLIEIMDDEPGSVPEGWLHARLTNRQSGYVRLSAVRSAIDYRAGFEKRDGKWVMTIFIAGD
jgi:hypothetical protein